MKQNGWECQVMGWSSMIKMRYSSLGQEKREQHRIASRIYKIGQDRIKQDRIGQDRIGQDRIGQDRRGQDRIGQDRIGQDRSRHNRPKRISETTTTSAFTSNVRCGSLWARLLLIPTINIVLFAGIHKPEKADRNNN